MDLAELRADVNAYVEEQLAGYVPRYPREFKVIRDAVYGFQRFEAYEIPVIDSPILQRLRSIHQTALTFLVYPSANHTRFEHSLGVASKASLMVSALFDEGMSDTDRIELRFAGLLHDTGHGLFSHLTEVIMEQLHPDLLKEIKRSEAEFPEKAHLGEALSALVVRSPAFHSLLEGVKNAYPHVSGLQDVDIDRIAGLILGRATDPSKQYLANIISGPFDADKLDYLGRDCHFTGINAQIDWERIVNALTIVEDAGRRELAAERAAVPHLEQILFNKMLMYSSVYHHHKVRALEAMVSSVFEIIRADPSAIAEDAFRFQRVTDIWRVTDAEFFVTGRRLPRIADVIQRIARRDLLQRSLEINISTVDDSAKGQAGYRAFQSLSDAPDRASNLRTLAAGILARIPAANRKTAQEIWLDFPSAPKLDGDAVECKIVVSGAETRSLNTFFPSHAWMATYVDNKLTANLFYSGTQEDRAAAAVAGKEVLREVYDLALKADAERVIK